VRARNGIVRRSRPAAAQAGPDSPACRLAPQGGAGSRGSWRRGRRSPAARARAGTRSRQAIPGRIRGSESSNVWVSAFSTASSGRPSMNRVAWARRAFSPAKRSAPGMRRGKRPPSLTRRAPQSRALIWRRAWSGFGPLGARKTARKDAGSVALALRLTRWWAPGPSDQRTSVGSGLRRRKRAPKLSLAGAPTRFMIFIEWNVVGRPRARAKPGAGRLGRHASALSRPTGLAAPIGRGN
jgi:hypothetical protein